MAYLAKMTMVGTPTGIAEFILAKFPDGWMNVQRENVVEEITAGGTDGTRMRIIRTDFRKFRFVAMADFGTFEDAVNARNEAFSFKGRVCSLEVLADGVWYFFPNKIYIWDVSATPAPAKTVAVETLVEDSAGNAIVTYEFVLQGTTEALPV